MSRIRTVKPEFWSDETIGGISPNARLLFLATLNIADDEGLLVWSPSFLRSQAFAYDNFSVEVVAGLMAELEASGLVLVYKDGNQKPHGWIVNFRKHQRIDKPQASKLPLPSLQNPEVKQRYGIRDKWKCHICSGEVDPLTSDKSKVPSLDHLKPKADGGIDAPSNIRLAHFGCNSGKKDKPLPDHSENPPIQIQDQSNREGKGMEGNGKKEEDAAPDGAHSDEADLFRRGKTLLGKNAGGLVTDLLKAKNKNIALARSALEMAATKQDPREYIGAIIRGRDSPEDLRARGEAW